MLLSALMWCSIVVVVFYLLATEPEISGVRGHSWIPAVFFLSGFPALIYQIVWQRVLSLAFGSNIESVTIIVTAFVLGLGIGSFAGGWVSTRIHSPVLWFAGLEIGVGAIGASSLIGFRWLIAHTTSLSIPQTAALAFLVLLLPTALMGATLPFLVTHLLRHCSSHVGRSVALLYFVNTLGSALACFICAQFAMRLLGESGTIWAACAMNFAVGTVALSRSRTSAASVASDAPTRNPTSSSSLPYIIALVLAAFSGFVALGYEILWYRVYAVAASDRAPVFAFLLGAYLLGLAFGSLFVESRCRRPGQGLDIDSIGWLLVGFNFCAFAVVPVLGLIVKWADPHVALILIAVAATCLGSAFPLIAHFSIPAGRRSGFRLGGIYFSNMVGSALGSLAIGFSLANVWRLQSIAVALLLAGVGCGICILASRRKFRAVAMALLLVTAATAASSILYRNIYDKLLLKRDYPATRALREVVENRNGVIAVDSQNAVFGDGVYDGRFNVDLVHDTNMIVRCYAISSFHPHPRKVLMIGLSSGSWAQVLANHPDVQELTVVEINPGYLHLIPRHAQVASVLHNPKVKIVIDDGRRWLRANPEQTFDMVVINTSFYWRARSTNLLSTEFLQLVRSHLSPGGALFYNTTSSSRVQLTGVTVFPYGVRVANFLAVSDSPLNIDKTRLRQVLAEYQLDGKPVLDPGKPGDTERLKEILGMLTPVTISDKEDMMTAEYAESIRQRSKGLRVITDNNMGDEW